jgi:mannose-6-phosphate isomerase-like protein (cupin superfamily)
MDETTLIKHHDEMRREPLPECHGGEGALDWTTVLDSADVAGRQLNFIHDDIIPPGASIGVHRHEDDEEYYYIVEGEGVMTLDGERYEVGPGDITAVYPGGEHGLENTSDAPMRILVVSVA